MLVFRSHVDISENWIIVALFSHGGYTFYPRWKMTEVVLTWFFYELSNALFRSFGLRCPWAELRSSYTMRTKCAISDAFVRDCVFAYCASVAQHVYSLSAEHCFRLRNNAISDERFRDCALSTHSVFRPLEDVDLPPPPPHRPALQSWFRTPARLGLSQLEQLAREGRPKPRKNVSPSTWDTLSFQPNSPVILAP